MLGGKRSKGQGRGGSSPKEAPLGNKDIKKGATRGGGHGKRNYGTG